MDRKVRVGFRFGGVRLMVAGLAVALMAALVFSMPVFSTSVYAQEAPGKPTNLKAMPSSSLAITLTWNAPADSDVAGYQILRRRPREGEKKLMVHVADTGSTETTYTDSGLTDGTKYTYRVKAINSEGVVGGWSNYSWAEAKAVPPGKPTNLRVTAVTGTSISLAWDAPPETDVVGYRILTRRPAYYEKKLYASVSNTGSTGATWTASDLEPGVEYIYRVKAINSSGMMGGMSNNVRLYTKTFPRPTNLRTTGVTHNSVSLAWDAPADDTGIEGYDVLRRLEGMPGPMETHYLGPLRTATTWTETKLDPETTYIFRVRATNAEGQRGKPSRLVKVTTKAAPASAPTFAESSYTRSIAENSAAGANVGAAITATNGNDVTLTYTLTGTGADNFSVDDTGQISVATGASLDYETSTSYSLTLTASDGELEGTATVNISITDVDEAGTVTVTPSSAAVDTELTAILTDPDGSVSGESWQWTRADTENGAASDISGATSAGYTAVAADAGKYLRAQASYTDGEGSGKSAQSAAVMVAAIEKEENEGEETPGKSLKAPKVTAEWVSTASQDNGNRSKSTASTTEGYVKLTWTNPTGGVTPTGYQVSRHITDYNNGFKTYWPCDSYDSSGACRSATEYRDEELRGSVTYTYAVRLVKRADGEDPQWSPWSDKVTAAVPALTNPYPAEPANVTLTEVLHENDDPKVTVSWDAVAGSASYSVYRSEWTYVGPFGSGEIIKGEYSVLGSSLSTTSYDDTTIEPGSTYAYKVLATNQTGSSPFSKITIIHTTGLIPRIPGIPELTATFDDTDKAVLLSWTPPPQDDAYTSHTIFRGEKTEDEYRAPETPGNTFMIVRTWIATRSTSLTRPLDDGFYYLFLVRSCTSIGCTDYSNSVAVNRLPELGADEDAPGQPTGIVAGLDSAPSFSESSYSLSVAENSAAETNVGAPITATDADGDALTYSLSGTGSDNFSVDSSGQIAVATGASLDYETTTSYSLTLTASDGELEGTATVNISITDVKD